MVASRSSMTVRSLELLPYCTNFQFICLHMQTNQLCDSSACEYLLKSSYVNPPYPTYSYKTVSKPTNLTPVPGKYELLSQLRDMWMSFLLFYFLVCHWWSISQQWVSAVLEIFLIAIPSWYGQFKKWIYSGTSL